MEGQGAQVIMTVGVLAENRGQGFPSARNQSVPFFTWPHPYLLSPFPSPSGLPYPPPLPSFSPLIDYAVGGDKQAKKQMGPGAASGGWKSP